MAKDIIIEKEADREVVLTRKECRRIASLIRASMQKRLEYFNPFFVVGITAYAEESDRDIKTLLKLAAPHP